LHYFWKENQSWKKTTASQIPEKVFQAFGWLLILENSLPYSLARRGINELFVVHINDCWNFIGLVGKKAR